jgi:hypothetical protein
MVAIRQRRHIHSLMDSQKVHHTFQDGSAQKFDLQGNGGVAKAEAYIRDVEHFANPPRRSRSDFLRRHHSLLFNRAGAVEEHENRD